MAYGDSALDLRTCQNWFARFKTGYFYLIDKDRCGRPVETNDSILRELLQKDPRQASRDIAIELNCSPNTVLNQLRALGKVQKTGKWVSHNLSKNNINRKLINCISLPLKQKKSFLHKIVSGDEKWLYYDNPVNVKQWLTSYRR